MTYDVIVIGGGANGLVAAAALGKGGLRVLLLERDETLGGQGRVVEFAPGFRAAPLGLDPGWLPGSIASALGLEGLKRSGSEADVAVAVEPGRFLALSRDAARSAEAIGVFSKSDAAKWPTFTARLRKLAGFLEELYQAPAPDIAASSLGELMPLLGLGRKFRALGRHDMIEFLRTLPLSVWELLDDWFENPALKAAVAAGGIQDHQQGPRSGGTGFVLLHHLVGAPQGAVRGRTPWLEGPEAFTRAAEGAARRLGVTVRAGAAVKRIMVADDAVTGVVVNDGEEIAAKVVLSTANPARTFFDWVDPVWLDPEFLHALKNIRHRGCTAFVAYALERPLDVPGLPGDALAGMVSLTPTIPALEKAADAAKYGTVSDRPHVEFMMPTSPDGKHILIARCQYAPYRCAWDALAKTVTAAIEAVSPCFSSRILHQVAWTPKDLEEKFGLREGATSHGELGLDQILFMRPVAGWAGHATPVPGLYLGGAGSHPGPGVLGGAGWLAAKRILGDRGRA